MSKQVSQHPVGSGPAPASPGILDTDLIAGSSFPVVHPLYKNVPSRPCEGAGQLVHLVDSKGGNQALYLLASGKVMLAQSFDPQKCYQGSGRTGGLRPGISQGARHCPFWSRN